MPLVDPVLVLAERGTDGGGDPATAPVAPTRAPLTQVRLTQAARELLTAARRIGTPVTATITAPSAAADPAQDLARLTDLVRRISPRAILIPHDPAGEETAARLAVRLESGLVTDVTAISLDDAALHVVQDVAAGACRIATRLCAATPIITVRRGAFPAEAPASAETVAPADSWASQTSDMDEAEAGPQTIRPTRVLRRWRKRETGRDLILDTADVVVAGGRGVGSAEGFSLLARVAAVLGGCLGGTHTTCELGWAPEHARISLPGAQIRPRLYLAGGVSGSVRHRAAIRRARTVVAIDEDPSAPILREADFGIIGDLHQVLPALLDELARRTTPDPSVVDPPDQPDPLDPPESPALPAPPAQSRKSEPAEA